MDQQVESGIGSVSKTEMLTWLSFENLGDFLEKSESGQAKVLTGEAENAYRTRAKKKVQNGLVPTSFKIGEDLIEREILDHLQLDLVERLATKSEDEEVLALCKELSKAEVGEIRKDFVLEAGLVLGELILPEGKRGGFLREKIIQTALSKLKNRAEKAEFLGALFLLGRRGVILNEFEGTTKRFLSLDQPPPFSKN